MGEWRVPGFVEVRELGVGGQGRAVLVREDGSGRVAVVKYVATIGDVAARDQFRQESVLLKRVQSPYVARWYGHYEGPAASAILMEAVDGVSLKEVLNEHAPLSPEAALLVLKGSLLGLDAAHELGVVHRDYKPANVIVRADGLSKLIDFGVATLVGERARSGTPAYMAPEQWRGEPATPATDVYAATCVFFECITGHKPYEASDISTLQTQHLYGPIPVGEVPTALRGLVERGLAKNPHGRPGDFVTELDAIASAEYGEDWESHGAEILATTAATLATLFPLAALLVPGTTAPATIGPAVISTGSRTGKGMLTRFGSAKVVAGLTTGTAIVVAASGVAITATSHKGIQAPRPQPASIAFTIAVENETFTHPDINVRNAQFFRVGGIGNPVRQLTLNAALRAPLDSAIQVVRGIGPCPGTTGVLSAQVVKAFSGPTLMTGMYRFSASNLCAGSGGTVTWLQAFTVDLRNERTLTADELWRPSTLTTAGLKTLASRLSRLPNSCNGHSPLQEVPLQRRQFYPIHGVNALVPAAISLLMVHDHIQFIRSYPGVGCEGFTTPIPYQKIRDLLRPEISAQVPE